MTNAPSAASGGRRGHRVRPAGSLTADGRQMTYGTALRDDIQGEHVTPLIGVFDMFSASLVAQHYGGMFISGLGFAASYYGLPDIGFIAWPDMVNFVLRLRLAFPRQHLLGDIDDCYVDPEVTCHAVENLEHIGASGVTLEDQKRPRRCGHSRSCRSTNTWRSCGGHRRRRITGRRGAQHGLDPQGPRSHRR